MVAAVVMLLVGGLDVGRSVSRDHPWGALTGMVFVATVSGVGFAIPWPSIAIAVVVSAAWFLATWRRTVVIRSWAAAVLVLIILTALLVDPLRLPEQSLVAGLIERGFAADHLSDARALAISGALLFLVSTSNRVVSAVLDAVRRGDADAGAVGTGGARSATGASSRGDARENAGARRWRVAFRDWRLATIEEEGRASDEQDLRGGRVIGPLERVLLLLLTIAGALPIAAGVLAAKGIVRFPEISRDGDRGAKAETFLVGTLVSLLAVGLAYLVVTSIA